VAVNCSLTLLERGEGSTVVRQALEASGFNPDRLTVELPGRAIANDHAVADLQALASLGVHLAVDDVTTSWHALEALRRFAIDTVKIDKALIGGLAPEGMNRAVVEAVVSVSRSLTMSTVAEGVETAEQVAMLRRLGADAAQGHFFAHPMPNDTAEVLATSDPRPVFSLNAANGTEAVDHYPLGSEALPPEAGVRMDGAEQASQADGEAPSRQEDVMVEASS
jgi:EAL domain-containing protein (putative c-di-GMP-specific phosphodiesterase class I)